MPASLSDWYITFQEAEVGLVMNSTTIAKELYQSEMERNRMSVKRLRKHALQHGADIRKDDRTASFVTGIVLISQLLALSFRLFQSTEMSQ